MEHTERNVIKVEILCWRVRERTNRVVRRHISLFQPFKLRQKIIQNLPHTLVSSEYIYFFSYVVPFNSKYTFTKIRGEKERSNQMTHDELVMYNIPLGHTIASMHASFLLTTCRCTRTYVHVLFLLRTLFYSYLGL